MAFVTPTTLRLTQGGVVNLDFLASDNTARLTQSGIVGNGLSFSVSGTISAAISGTVNPTATEVDVVNGGKTLIVTLIGDIWAALGVDFDAQRQAIINGLVSAQVELTGWNNEVKAKELVTAVVRDSDTQITIALSAAIAYDITATETITTTIPASALVTSTADVIADSDFTITAIVGGGFKITWFANQIQNQLIGAT